MNFKSCNSCTQLQTSVSLLHFLMILAAILMIICIVGNQRTVSYHTIWTCSGTCVHYLPQKCPSGVWEQSCPLHHGFWYGCSQSHKQISRKYCFMEHASFLFFSFSWIVLPLSESKYSERKHWHQFLKRKLSFVTLSGSLSFIVYFPPPNKNSYLLQVAHMTKNEMEYFDSALIGPLMLFLNQYFSFYIPEYIVLWMCLVSYIFLPF